MNLVHGEKMARRIGGTIEPQKEILDALQTRGPSTWSALQARSGLSKGAISKHLKELIDSGRVTAEVGEAEGRRTTLYRLLDKGTWEYERNRITSFLSSIKTPAANNTVLKEGKMLYGSVLEFEEEIDFNIAVDALNKYVFGNKALVGMMEMIFKDMIGAKKAAITILYDGEGGFSINGTESG